jgi:two-component system response regulator HydG
VKPSALIVDDNRALAEDLGEILNAEGFEVKVFFDPLEASRICDSLSFDIAILDVRMPGMDGVELFRLLVQKHPNSSFILMSAYADDRRLAQALSEGVRRVLTKPLSLPELLELIHCVIQRV